MFHGCTPLPSSGSLGKLWWVALAKWLLDVSWSHALSLSWPKSLWSGFWMVYSSLQQKAWSWARTPYGVEVYLTVFLLRLPMNYKWSHFSWQIPLLLLYSLSVMSDSATPWIAACQASLSFTVSHIQIPPVCAFWTRAKIDYWMGKTLRYYNVSCFSKVQLYLTKIIIP